MLTGHGEVNEIVKGLQLGADDYLPKPFAMPELLARVRALGRRYAQSPDVILRVQDLTFSLADQQVHRGSPRINLSSRELKLLKILMREPGRVFNRSELCQFVWYREHDYDDKLVEVFIGRLRKKLGEPQLIETVRHVGYKINPGEEL
jgi:two-component system, OmpR family, response regulator